MFLSRLLFNRVNSPLLVRLNELKNDDLSRLFTEDERQRFFQLKQTVGGEFRSIDQIKQLPIDHEKFSAFLSKPKKRESRIQIEPRLTPTSSLTSVCSLDYTSSHVNYARLRLIDDTKQIEVEEWNSLPVRLEKKFHFLKTFDQFSSLVADLRLTESDSILLDQSSYRMSTLQLANYLTQLQQTRAVFHTLIHCRSRDEKKKIYHISSRDVSNHFGLFVGNEQSSWEFYLTNLFFGNDGEKSSGLKIDDRLKSEFFRTSQGQREPRAQCLLRALAFLQLVREKTTNKD